MANHGFVYVLGNQAMPGIYKIGMTDRSPWSRCDELSSATAVPYHFNVLAFIPTEDALSLEQDIHEYFESARCSPKREFFKIGFSRIISDISELFLPPIVTSDGSREIINDAARRKSRNLPPDASFHAASLYCRPADLNEEIGIMDGVHGIDVISFMEESKCSFMTPPDEIETGEGE